MSFTLVVAFAITLISSLFGAVCLWKIGSQLQKIHLEETSSTLLFQFLHLRSFSIFYITLFTLYTFAFWLILSIFHL